MDRIKHVQRWIIFAVFCALLFPPTLAGRARQTQAPKTITGIGTMLVIYEVPLYLEFPPAGGLVSGFADVDTHSMTGVCPGTMNFKFSGTFAGGDGGVASGTYIDTQTIEETQTCTASTQEFNGTWSGHFYANGTGNGIINELQTWWGVTYSPDEFQAALKPPVTKDYIFTTYGIKLVDSSADDPGGQKAWSENELSLMNDVLSQIPPDLLKSMALSSIVRSVSDVDEKGKKIPSTFGDYSPCGESLIYTDCTGSSATIRVFDAASSPFDFTDDPNGDTEFKGTILHELIHAMQYRKDSSSIYADPYESDLVENFINATRPDQTPGVFIPHNGWSLNVTKGWQPNGAPGNMPPTKYAETNPTEDMSESAMMYVYDPQKLKASSPLRYNFIKDKMFGGVEYENGIQKKP